MRLFSIKWLFIIVPIIISGCAATMFPAYYTSDLKGRHADVVAELEPQTANQTDIPMDKRFLLCRAYARIKNYNKLFPCLDHLQQMINSGAKEPLILLGYTVIPALLRAEALIELGRYDEAIEQAERAYHYMMENNLHHNRYKWSSEETLSVLGLAYALGGRREKAEEMLAKLSKLNSHGLAKEWKNIGLAKIYIALGRYEEAVRVASLDVPGQNAWVKVIVSTISGAPDLWASLELPYKFIRYKALFETGRLQEAKSGYDDILAVPQTQDNGEIYWNILFDRGRIALKEGQKPAAIIYFKKALDVIEQQRSTINSEANKIGFVGDKQAVYQYVIKALFEEERFWEAFEYVERGKARALVDLLATKKKFVARKQGHENISSLLSELETAENQSITLAYQPNTLEQRAEVRALMVEKKEQITRTSRQLASFITVNPLAAKNIQSLLASDETLIEFYYHGRSGFTFVVGQNTINVIPFEVQGLQQDIASLREHIMDSRSEDCKTLARALFKRLIHPVSAMIPTKNITIVPHGAMHYLPFNALYASRGYLLEDYHIRILPSASVLEFIKTTQNDRLENLIAFGNPNLDDPRLDLPFTQEEVIAITQGWPHSRVLLRNHATETAVKKFSGQFRYIHLATHGTFNPGIPLQSGLMLSSDQQNDGMLTVQEIFDLILNADLVTLSACESALGKVASGDDVVGFTRGFLYAGADSIVSSLWKVDDQATSILMQQFYKSLKESDKRSALRTAQLKVKDTYNSHPYYWAAFQITGSVQ